MPGKRAADKTTLSVTIPRTLMRRLKKLAIQKKCTVTDVVLSLIGYAVKDVELTSIDYSKIAEETKKAEMKNT